jgi:hypothetical protein
VTFNGPVNSAAAGNGSITITAGLGDVTFADAVGETTPLASLTLTAAGTVDVSDDLSVRNSIRIVAREVNFNGGAASVIPTSATTTLSIEAPTGVNLALNGAVDTGAAVLDFTASDFAALADGFSGITMVNGAGADFDIVVAGGLTVSAPLTVRQRNGRETIDIQGPLVATGNGGFTFTGGTTLIGDNITTASGNIDLGTVRITGDVALTTMGGSVMVRGSFTPVGTPDLTISTGAGDITLMGAGGIPSGVLAATFGTVTLTSSGNTTIKTSLYAGDIWIDGDGTATLSGVLQSSGTTGLTISANVIAVSSLRLTAIGADAAVNVTGTVNSSATRPAAISVLARNAALADTAVTFSGQVGNTNRLGVITVTTTGIANFDASVFATSFSATGSEVEVGAVDTTRNQFYRGEVTFGGMLNAESLMVVSTGDVTQLAPWTVTNSASVLAPATGTVMLSNPANDFGRISFRGSNVTIVENSDLVLFGGQAAGVVSLTSTTGSITDQAPYGLNVGTLHAEAGINVTLDSGNRINNLGTVTAGGDVTIRNGAGTLTLTDVVTSGGDIIIVANATLSRGNLTYLPTAGLNASGRFVIYSYFRVTPRLNTDLTFFNPDEEISGKTELTATVPPGVNTLVYVIAPPPPRTL